MMMTEAEAATKWCPFSRIAEGANRGVAGCNETHCYGSACMAWRQEIVATTETDQDGEHVEARIGYCGLAGKPGDTP